MVKKDFLNFGKYLKKGEINITPEDCINPIWALVVNKGDFKKGTDFSNITEEDLVGIKIPGSFPDNAQILLYDGRRFDTKFQDVFNRSQSYESIISDFEVNGYTTVGDSLEMFITADGGVYGYNEDREVIGNPHYRYQTIDKEEKERGKLLGKFLRANQENKLEEFLSDSSILSQENLEHINKQEFKKIFRNAVKLEWQVGTFNTHEEMLKDNKPKEDISKTVKEMRDSCKEELEIVDSFFKNAKTMITTEENVSELDETLDEINSL